MFSDRSWLNTTLTDNRTMLKGSDFDGFEKVKEMFIALMI